MEEDRKGGRSGLAPVEALELPGPGRVLSLQLLLLLLPLLCTRKQHSQAPAWVCLPRLPPPGLRPPAPHSLHGDPSFLPPAALAGACGALLEHGALQTGFLSELSLSLSARPCCALATGVRSESCPLFGPVPSAREKAGRGASSSLCPSELPSPAWSL